MSLINNMLNDLERREASDFAPVNSVIADLEGIDELSLTKEKQPSSTLRLLPFLLLTSALAAVLIIPYQVSLPNLLTGFFDNPIEERLIGEQNVIQDEYGAQFNTGIITSLDKADILSINKTIDSNDQNSALSVKRDNLSLELDSKMISLSHDQAQGNSEKNVVLPVIPDQQQIYSIDYVVRDERPKIFFRLSQEPEYRLQMLESPDRLLIEFNRLTETDSLSRLFQNPPEFITAVRTKIEDDNYQYILQFDRKLKLINTSYSINEDGYSLVVELDFVEATAFVNSRDRIEETQITEDSTYKIPQNNDLLPRFSEATPDELIKQEDKNVPQPEVVSRQSMNKVVHENDGVLSSQRLFESAQSNYHSGKIDVAINELKQALESNIDNASARMLLAEIYIATGNHTTAITTLIEGLDRDLTQSNMAKLCAQLLLEEGNNQLALMYLQAAIPGVSQDPEYYALIAALMQREKRHQQAITYYQELLKYDSTQGLWWMGLAISLEAEGSRQQALAAYKNARTDVTLSTEVIHYLNQRINFLAS